MSKTTNPPALADHADRQRFVSELDRNFCVAASAGAGKTTAIVNRVVALAQGADGERDLARLVVATYTRAAAEELRARARTALFQSLPAQGGHRQRVLAAFGRTFFGTIHSFCLDLLRAEGRHLGLPADLELLEESDERLWTRFAEQAADATDHPAPRQLFRHYTFDQILRLAKILDAPAAEFFAASAPPPDAPPLTVSGLLEFKPKQQRGMETTAAHIRRLSAWFAQFRAGEGFLGIPTFEKGNSEFLAAVNATFRPYVAWLNAHAAKLAAQVAVQYRDYRAARGLVSFDDMVTWAQQLLADAAVRRRLQERELIIVLDEAQDTHPAMFRVLTELARPAGSEPDAWPARADAAPPAAGRFCFVGDEQQMIYSQRADLALYHQYVTAFRAGRGGELLDFSVTMRCPLTVINAVNAIFSGRLDQPLVKFKTLRARPGAADGAVVVVPLTADGAPPRTDTEKRRAEFAQVADWLLAKGAGGLGVGGWDEVAVLAPRRDWLAAMAAALRARGLPCRLVSSRARRRELPAYAWPVALLHTLTQPDDRFELIGVLRDIFGVADAELLAAHRATPSGLELSANPAGCPLTAGALELLRGLRRAATGSGCLALARKILAATKLAGRIRASGGDPLPLAEFEHSARAADLDGLGWLDWLENLRRELEREPPPADGGAGEIQLLTCHKSKGLQWPVVVPIGFGSGQRPPPVEYPQVGKVNGQWAAHFDACTREPADTDDETRRLFYVTLTRAQRLLVLPDSSALYRTKTGFAKGSFAALVRWDELDPLTLAGGSIVTVSDRPADGAVAPPLAAAPSPAALAAANETWRRILPHTLARHTSAADADADGAERATPADAPTGGLEYGTWWHQLMRDFPWRSPAAARERYLRAQVAVAPAQFRQRGERETALLWQSALLKKLTAAGAIFLPETPFSALTAPGTALEGVIDLVVVGADGDCVVADWKTNHRRREESDADFHRRLREIYAPQLRAYADLLTRQFHRTVSGCWLYATVSGSIIEINAA
ncbi:MAG: UvrD-helicase domain-containing protein [Verrucomicrobiales bacterium]|jgi:ATP-dependent exoDNAse (exonuclease V) beta subunit|nr:UvrD-helicase domain-containing protein [Verrucomicrobiales bacterium]